MTRFSVYILLRLLPLTLSTLPFKSIINTLPVPLSLSDTAQARQAVEQDKHNESDLPVLNTADKEQMPMLRKNSIKYFDLVALAAALEAAENDK